MFCEHGVGDFTKQLELTLPFKDQSDPLHILIVGHNLQAKCDVANAFIKQANRFKQFKCRSKLIVKNIDRAKSKETVAGRQLNIILTPNLNTSRWTHLSADIISGYENRVFVYVKAPGLVRVDDDTSIKNLQAKFKAPAFQVHVITYYESDEETDSAIRGGLFLRAKMPFKEKISRVNGILEAIEMQLGGSVKIHYAEEKVEEPDTKLDREGADQLPLQEKIETKDWDLLCQTLRYGRAKSNHVRVNIIGNQQAGKTTLVKRLHNMDVQCPDKHQIPTEVFEINEVSSRCKEIDGEKHWDTKREGYMEDLNVQRMAQAMKSVERNQADDTSTGDIKEENLDADIMLIVNADENIRGKKQKPLNADKAEKSRVQYMKKILRKKYHTRGERIYVSYWDIAGQSTYYSTHQIFMSPSAVYVLVVDLSLNFKEKVSDKLQFRAGIIKECTVEESLKFWISSIGAFATDSKGGMAPVVIVGTHIDKLRQAAKANAEEEINRKFDEVREILQMSEVECIAVDNTIQNNSDMIALRNRILELGLGVIDEEIPAQWIDLKRRLREIKSSGKAIMTFADLQCLDESMDAPMRDKEKLEAFLGHQHNRGHVICFLHEDLKNLIILEPNILAKFLNNLMRRRDDKEQREMKSRTSMYNHNGIINRNYVIETVKMMNEHKTLLHNVDKLLNMLVHLFIIRPYKSDKTHIKYILPCLLPDRTEYDLKRMNESVKTKRFQIVFPDNHMPPTFYYVLVGGLLKEWKLIEKNPDMPEIYNLYACFRLDSETQQLEIFWKESQVYINLKNYSRDKEWERNKIVEILEIVKKRIQKVFLVYRHTNEDYEIRVQCPEHKTSFVSLAAIMRDGEAMCNDDTLKHGLTYEDVFHSKLLETNPLLKEKPTDKHLGRLAIYLVREEAISLAARLRLHLSLIEVDRAAQKTSDTNMRRLYILYKWRSSNGFATLGDLIELLTVTKDYHTDELLKQLETSPERQKYAIPSKRLDCIPENNVDIKIASKYIGALFQFLMLELGLHVVEIEADIANNRGDMYNTIFCLLDKWRKKHAENSTTRTLLDTASFVGIDTIEMQKEIIKKSQQLRY